MRSFPCHTRFRRGLAGALVAGVLATLMAPVSASAAPPTPVRSAAPVDNTDQTTIAPSERDRLLGSAWRSSTDIVWTTAGDARGFHLLVAEASAGYTWRTVATLVEPTLSSDQWVGNACLTGSGTRAVVVYEPRHFTNREHLFNRGAFAAVVDLASGRVTKLNTNVSIAYHNPGCGPDERAMLTTGGATDLGRTRIQAVDTTSATITTSRQLPGQVTSAVPFGTGFAAVRGSDVIGVDKVGTVRTLAKTRGLTAQLRAVGTNGLAFLERVDHDTAVVRHLQDGAIRDVVRGPSANLGLESGLDGSVFVTGAVPSRSTLPAGMRRVDVPASARVSTTGAAAVLRTQRTAPRAPDTPEAVSIATHVTSSRSEITFVVAPGSRASAQIGTGRSDAPPLRATRTADTAATSSSREAASATSPLEPDRYCSVPRNALNNQVEQPHWKQVEWAANMAVQDGLTFTRPDGWRGSGLPAWTPRSVAPPKPLAGGGAVPAQILLAILAQESNLWQASWHALEGVAANPLVGVYYGTREGWTINWAEADCGYGVAQVTDGMRMAGRGKPGEVIRPENQQRAIALDYASNIQAGLQILQDKWNQTYNAGIRLHNADPRRIENWFAAVWAYNSGLNPQASTGNTSGCSPSPSCTDDRGMWGLGWGNNPANPDYDFRRKPFLNGSDGTGSPSDAANPQRWPYPEKIMGWAAFPIVKTDYRLDDFYEAAYRQAWWMTDIARGQGIKPWLDTFCTTANNCTVHGDNGPGECGFSNFHCWWHWPASYQPDCERNCGFANDLIPLGTPEPARGTHYPPQCRIETIPGNAYVIDDQPAASPVVRSDLCPQKTRNDGTFTLQFSGAPNGTFPSKRDFHQIGSGLNGHYWFGHEYNSAMEANNRVKVTGTWQLGRTLNQWASVYVHMPNRGGRTQQAHYKVDRGANVSGQRYKWRVVGQKYEPYNRWVSLGTFQFNGTPKIELSNITSTATTQAGVDTVAWDAVAILPLTAKPRNFVVGLGDSFSSGEGVVENIARDYSPESNHDGDGSTTYRNGCHRSQFSWLRQATLLDDPNRAIGARSDAFDPSMDLQFLACSGAESENIIPSGNNPVTGVSINDPATGQPFQNEWGQYASGGTMREVTQLDRGFLDENTTLVTLTVGGNDIGWAAALTKCATNTFLDCMQLDVDGQRIADYIPTNISRYLPNTIYAVLRSIKVLAPNAKIVLLGYPALISKQAYCLRLPGIPWGISAAEDEWITQMANDLDSALNAIITNARNSGINVRYGSPMGDFQGSGVCGDDPAIHFPVLATSDGEKPGILSAHNFHPNMKGGLLYRDVLNRALRASGL